MTKSELDELLADCPTLYHMAERGSWPSIQQRGLLSTTALLDLYGITGDKRMKIEGQRRPAGVLLEHAEFPKAVIRDQIPMDDAGLTRALPPGMQPSEWYRLINGKVFFWFTRERLLTLLNAGAYRRKIHDVIEVAARSLVEAYFQEICLCPMNSGCTKPFPHPRDKQTFCSIPDYDYLKWRRKRKRGERVVELAVNYSVPNIREFVRRVVEMQGDQQLKLLYAAG